MDKTCFCTALLTQTLTRFYHTARGQSRLQMHEGVQAMHATWPHQNDLVSSSRTQSISPPCAIIRTACKMSCSLSQESGDRQHYTVVTTRTSYAVGHAGTQSPQYLVLGNKGTALLSQNAGWTASIWGIANLRRMSGTGECATLSNGSTTLPSPGPHMLQHKFSLT